VKKDRKQHFTCQEPWDCEYALASRCTCRCEGALHGLKRTMDLSSLPLGDPHQIDRQGKLDLGGKHVN
jgi:hypothetical protein